MRAAEPHHEHSVLASDEALAPEDVRVRGALRAGDFLQAVERAHGTSQEAAVRRALRPGPGAWMVLSVGVFVTVLAGWQSC